VGGGARGENGCRGKKPPAAAPSLMGSKAGSLEQNNGSENLPNLAICRSKKALGGISDIINFRPKKTKTDFYRQSVKKKATNPNCRNKLQKRTSPQNDKSQSLGRSVVGSPDLVVKDLPGRGKVGSCNRQKTGERTIVGPIWIFPSYKPYRVRWDPGKRKALFFSF